jgi:hypothetical protein
LGILLEKRLILGDHIPDNNGELTGGGSNSSISAPSVSDPFKKGSEGMFGLISNAIGSLA